MISIKFSPFLEALILIYIKWHDVYLMKYLIKRNIFI